MTIKVKQWYRVKSTKQYCMVQRIPSTTNPQINVPKADENTRGFEVALVWYAPADEKLKKWTKRVMIVQLKKAVNLLREPSSDDLPVIAKITSIANRIPVSSASRDGEFTWPV
jgi:hypothetical protein